MFTSLSFFFSLLCKVLYTTLQCCSLLWCVTDWYSRAHNCKVYFEMTWPTGVHMPFDGSPFVVIGRRVRTNYFPYFPNYFLAYNLFHCTFIGRQQHSIWIAPVINRHIWCGLAATVSCNLNVLLQNAQSGQKWITVQYDYEEVLHVRVYNPAFPYVMVNCVLGHKRVLFTIEYDSPFY